MAAAKLLDSDQISFVLDEYCFDAGEVVATSSRRVIRERPRRGPPPPLRAFVQAHLKMPPHLQRGWPLDQSRAASCLSRREGQAAATASRGYLRTLVSLASISWTLDRLHRT